MKMHRILCQSFYSNIGKDLALQVGILLGTNVMQIIPEVTVCVYFT